MIHLMIGIILGNISGCIRWFAGYPGIGTTSFRSFSCGIHSAENAQKVTVIPNAHALYHRPSALSGKKYSFLRRSAERLTNPPLTLRRKGSQFFQPPIPNTESLNAEFRI